MTTITPPRATVEQALEALEKTMNVWGGTCAWHSDVKHAITALRGALAQQAEPVAKVELMMTGGNAGLATRIVEIEDHLRERLRPGQQLYTAPPQRKLVPLTEEEIDKIFKHLCDTVGASCKTMARAVEKASWEKNHGQA